MSHIVELKGTTLEIPEGFIALVTMGPFATQEIAEKARANCVAAIASSLAAHGHEPKPLTINGTKQ